jgi:fluoroacetyl-CoA thioesterase
LVVRRLDLEALMDPHKPIQPGLTLEESFFVAEAHLANHVGSGGLPVLATPVMITWMEQLSHRLLEENLPAGTSSVGVQMTVQHLAPTPPGGVVRVRCQVVEVIGREVLFEVKAWDEHELVGEGHHRRVIIDSERFMRRVTAKQGREG